MLKDLSINNFKSINEFSIELGRFNVFIGENGCGKSNILEALAFPTAGFNNKIENDFLALRGVRISDPRFYKNGFNQSSVDQPVKISLKDDEKNFIAWEFENDNQPFSKWKISVSIDDKTYEKEISKFPESIKIALNTRYKKTNKLLADDVKKFLEQYSTDKSFVDLMVQNKIATEVNRRTKIEDYSIYAPENFFLRNFKTEEIFSTPVGYRGEGLLALIKIIKDNKPEEYKEIISNLVLIDWFVRFDVDDKNSSGEEEFHLIDKYLDEGIKFFDIRNSNEGFLFLLFYLTLFISDYTPSFFAIDNIDTALNPKLCSKLISLLASLSAKHDKQVILTTHNPAILDGLNLTNDDERLFVIARNAIGETKATRIHKKPPLSGESPVKLSEQFLRGYIGGLPKNF